MQYHNSSTTNWVSGNQECVGVPVVPLGSFVDANQEVHTETLPGQREAAIRAENAADPQSSLTTLIDTIVRNDAHDGPSPMKPVSEQVVDPSEYRLCVQNDPPQITELREHL